MKALSKIVLLIIIQFGSAIIGQVKSDISITDE